MVKRQHCNPDNPLACYVLASDYDALAARLAALELAAWEAHEAIYCELEEPDQNSAAIISDAIAKLGELLPVQRPSVSASAVQPERCCLDYPRCDCNSPPEPDNEWHCSQYPGCECFAGCREKALEGQRQPCQRARWRNE